MKYFITATATASVLAVLLSFVIASPTYPNINARQLAVSCDFSENLDTFSITAQTTSDGQLRMNLFQDANDGVIPNQLGLLREADNRKSSDHNSAFLFNSSRSSPSDPFSFIMESGNGQNLEIAFDNSSNSFIGVQPGMGTEFDIKCDECTKGFPFAQDCSIAMPLTSVQSGQCITPISDSVSGPLGLQDCNFGTRIDQRFSLFTFVF